jgi:hypothetical protein
MIIKGNNHSFIDLGSREIWFDPDFLGTGRHGARRPAVALRHDFAGHPTVTIYSATEHGPCVLIAVRVNGFVDTFELKMIGYDRRTSNEVF